MFYNPVHVGEEREPREKLNLPETAWLGRSVVTVETRVHPIPERLFFPRTRVMQESLALDLSKMRGSRAQPAPGKTK